MTMPREVKLDDMSSLEGINSAIESFDSGELCGWELHLIKRRIEVEKSEYQALKEAADVMQTVLKIAKGEFWDIWHAEMSQERFDAEPVIENINAALNRYRKITG